MFDEVPHSNNICTACTELMCNPYCLFVTPNCLDSKVAVLVVLDWLLRKKFLDFFNLEELKWRLDDAVEQEGEVDEKGKTNNLEPLERLPPEAKRDNPNEQGTASVDGRPGGSANATGNRQTKKVEAPAERELS